MTDDTLGAEVEAAARALRWLAEDQETRSHGPAYLDSVADLIERLHREGEEARQRQPMIVTPCPSCGRRHLFIGSGGHLTCSLIDCKEPSAEDAVDTLRTQLQAACKVVEAARRVERDCDLNQESYSRLEWRAITNLRAALTEYHKE